MFNLRNVTKRLRHRDDDKSPDSPPGSQTFITSRIYPPKRRYLGRIISFCIDDHSIQMAAIQHLGGTPRILDISKLYFPRDNLNVKEKREFLSGRVADFMSDHGGRWTDVSLAVSGKETALRAFVMPILRKKELDGAVRFEVEKQIPFPIEDCIYDYRPVYRIVDGQRARYKIVLHAATKRLIKEQLEPFIANDLSISHIYHTQDVMGQLLRHLSDFSDDNYYSLLNIGHGHTEVSFYKGTDLEFSHSSPVGSGMLGSQLERTRYEYFAEALFTGIQTALDYYAGQYPTSQGSSMYVIGDTAQSAELLNLLNDRSGTELKPFPVERLSNLKIGDPTARHNLPACLPVLAAAICRTSIANLLPPEEKRERAQEKQRRYCRLAIALLALILLAPWGAFNTKLNVARGNLADIQREVDRFKSSDAFDTYNLLKRQIAVDQSYIEKIKESPSYLSLNLKELSNITPPSIRLFNLEYRKEQSGNNFFIQGVVESKDTPPEIVLAEYVEHLSASPFYDNVTITRHVKKIIEDGFEIEFQLGMEGII